MKLAFGTDHAAYALKMAMLPQIRAMGHEVEDFGCHSAEPCDHPDFSIPVAEAVARGQYDGAILACGSGQGMAIGANKVDGIRATLALTPEMAALAREHNNSNILVLPGRLVSPEQGMEIFRAWASTPFGGGRHAGRMDRITAYEKRRGKGRGNAPESD